MNREPIVNANGVAIVTALLALLVAFNVPLTDAQQAAIIGVVVVGAPAVAALWARRRSTPNVAVVERVEDGTVVAGEGSELPTGQRVREYGSLEVTDIGGYDGVTDEPRRAAE